MTEERRRRRFIAPRLTIALVGIAAVIVVIGLGIAVRAITSSGDSTVEAAPVSGDVPLTPAFTRPPPTDTPPPPTPTVSPTPPPPLPSPTPSLYRVRVTGPAAYRPGFPVRASIELSLEDGPGSVVASVGCTEVMLPEGTEADALEVRPGQGTVFSFVIPPGRHTPRCRVLVAGQECGAWTIEPSGEEADEVDITCVVGGAG